MWWHHDKQPSRDGVLRHLADAAEWKNLDQEYRLLPVSQGMSD